VKRERFKIRGVRKERGHGLGREGNLKEVVTSEEDPAVITDDIQVILIGSLGPHIEFPQSISQVNMKM
jgi:hypothetical protein